MMLWEVITLTAVTLCLALFDMFKDFCGFRRYTIGYVILPAICIREGFIVPLSGDQHAHSRNLSY